MLGIVAKVERDNAMKKIEEEEGIPVGSGYPSDLKTKAFLLEHLRKYGELPQYIRHTWNVKLEK